MVSNLGRRRKTRCRPQFLLDGVPVKPPPANADLPPAPGNTLIMSDHDADGVVYDDWKTETIEAGTEILGTIGGKKLKASSEDPKPGKAACMYCWQADRRMVKATHIVDYESLPSIVMCFGCAKDVQREIDVGVAPPGCSVRPQRG